MWNIITKVDIFHVFVQVAIGLDNADGDGLFLS